MERAMAGLDRDSFAWAASSRDAAWRRVFDVVDG
jgi:hypothetical protein